jgi:hypothetical protein
MLSLSVPLCDSQREVSVLISCAEDHKGVQSSEYQSPHGLKPIPRSASLFSFAWSASFAVQKAVLGRQWPVGGLSSVFCPPACRPRSSVRVHPRSSAVSLSVPPAYGLPPPAYPENFCGISAFGVNRGASRNVFLVKWHHNGHVEKAPRAVFGSR